MHDLLQSLGDTWVYELCDPVSTVSGGIWQQDPSGIKSQLSSSLSGSQARWKFVVGHHPIASFGSHCDFAMQGDCTNMRWLESKLQVCNMGVWNYPTLLGRMNLLYVCGIQGADSWGQK